MKSAKAASKVSPRALKIVEMSVEIIFPSGRKMSLFMNKGRGSQASPAFNVFVFIQLGILLLNH
jgi:hypothetical protein